MSKQTVRRRLTVRDYKGAREVEKSIRERERLALIGVRAAVIVAFDALNGRGAVEGELAIVLARQAVGPLDDLLRDRANNR